MKRIPLSDLEPGAWGIIAQLPDGIPSLTRLREMGLLPGTRVQFIRRAPLGDPVEISIRGALLSLRDKEAALIEVDRAP
ncbi:MAG TPA: FeoA family protein [Verrucomicrobiales bacterium]|jgi:Fe2+ transport system protein FeoA|nr:FeoA family protein [Verrucomicrobiales bacterium]